MPDNGSGFDRYGRMTDGQKGVLHALITQHEAELKQHLMDYGLLQYEDVGPGVVLAWVDGEPAQ